VGVEVGANCCLLRVIGGSGKILYTTCVPNGILDIIIILTTAEPFVSVRLTVVRVYK
jgi:hypothetical protein